MWLLLVVAAIAAAEQRGISIPPRICPTFARDDLLTCLVQVDLNEDGTITAAEVDTFISQHAACVPTTTTEGGMGSFVISQCDTDSSGNLTMTDWSDPSTCLVLRSRQLVLCWFCVKCGLYPPV